MDQLKELRNISGAPLKECKKALKNTQDSDDRISAALDWLRISGQSIAAQKAGDIAKYGFVAMLKNKNNAALVEVNCVTDFVENNPIFQDAVLNISNTILQNQEDITPNMHLSVDEIGHLPIIQFEDNKLTTQSVTDSLTDIIASIRENLVFRRAYKMQCSASSGLICGYVHGRKTDNLGMKASLVSLETDLNLNKIENDQREKLDVLGKNIATHIVKCDLNEISNNFLMVFCFVKVANWPQPKCIQRSEISENDIEKEKEILLASIMEKEGKAKDLEIVQKQIDGKMKKYFAENVLMEQQYCLEDDNKLTIEKLVDQTAKELECKIDIAHMAVYNLGEA